MRNFNTNQTRHLYVAEAIDANVDTNLDIALKTLATGEMFFSYKNADGQLVRSDTIDPKKVVSLKKAYATASGSVPGMDIPLKQHTITIKTTNYANVAALAGKTVKLKVTVHQVFDYSDSNYREFIAYHTVGSSETAAQFYSALETAVKDVVPTQFITASSSSNGLVLVEKLTKYVRGKLTGEPCPLTITFGIEGENEPEWGVDTVANHATAVYPSVYTIADLEVFSLGERGDMLRGYAYPNNYEPTLAVSLAKSYDMISIEYFWAGDAENVQKSPRLIEIAMPHAANNNPIDTLYASIASNVNKGDTAYAQINTPTTGLDARVTALENA